jgi:hypothetical protein
MTHAILYASPEGLGAHQVSVVLSPVFARKQHPSLEQAIQDTWGTRTKDNPHLYNGLKFRLDRLEPGPQFCLGITDYRDFLGTHYGPARGQLVTDGIARHGDPAAYLASPLGVESVVETEDGQLLFIKRSPHVAEMPGMYCCPGGHPEPSELGANDARAAYALDSVAVALELYQSVLREIRDEVNIPLDALSAPRMLGVVANLENAGKPDAVFATQCDLTADEVRQRYADGGHAECDESVELLALPRDEAFRHIIKLTPPSAGALELYEKSF